MSVSFSHAATMASLSTCPWQRKLVRLVASTIIFTLNDEEPLVKGWHVYPFILTSFLLRAAL